MADCIGCGSMHHDYEDCAKCGGPLCSDCYSTYAIDGACKDCRSEQQATDELKQELKQLQALIKHFPCINEFNEDKTAVTQTCPVYPGMTVWVPAEGESTGLWRIFVTSVHVSGHVGCNPGGRPRLFAVELCFNTREAAEAR